MLGKKLGLCAAVRSVGRKKEGCFAMMDEEQQSNVDSNSMSNPPLSKNQPGDEVS